MADINIFRKCIKNGQKFNYRSKEYRFVQDCKIYDYSADKLINVEKFDVELENVVIQDSDSLFSIVIGMVDDINKKPIPDLFVCVSDMTNENQFVIIRQNIYNPNFSDMKFHMGISWCNNESKDPPSNIVDGFSSYYNDKCKGYALYTYIEDNADTILKCIPARVKGVITSALKDMQIYYKNKNIEVIGIAETLDDLLIKYNFNELYKRSHNIYKFNGIIDRRKYNDDGSICLSNKTYNQIEDMLGKKIKNVSVVLYQRDINLNIEELKNIQHIVLYDKSYKIYLVMFDDIN